MRALIFIIQWLIVNAFVLQRRDRAGLKAPKHDIQNLDKKAEAKSSRVVQVAVNSSVLDKEVQSNIDSLIEKRATARWNSDYQAADEYRKQLESVTVPAGFRVALRDISREKGGGSSWSLLYEVPVSVVSKGNRQSSSVLSLAHQALGMAISYSERGGTVPSGLLQDIVARAKEQLLGWNIVEKELSLTQRTGNDGDEMEVDFEKLNALLTDSPEALAQWSVVQSELTGRKAADAAFWFAIAGTTDSELFSLLTIVCVKEIKRFGNRPSCRSIDILAIVNRLAAAGIKENEELEEVVRHCLYAKGTYEQIRFSGSENLLCLHSDYCALMIWNFSTRQRKQRSFLLTAAKHWESHNPESSSAPTKTIYSQAINYEWVNMFEDPTRPLIIDLGCGYGLSILGLSSLKRQAPCRRISVDWSEHNFVGVDLSSVSIQYANGITKRWNVGGKLAFVVDSANHFLEQIKTYPGPVRRVHIQFPTPYRLPSSLNDSKAPSHRGGNSQLPVSAAEGFMVTPDLLRQVREVLCNISGELLLQSNCGDVAVWMRQVACHQVGFVYNDRHSVPAVAGRLTKRTLDWIAIGGERAVGIGWCEQPILPSTGRTETEIACMLNDTPVHRCVLRPN